MKITKLMITLLCAITLSGCEHIVGAYNTLHELRTQYCETTSPEARAYIVEQIQRRKEGYQPVCGDDT